MMVRMWGLSAQDTATATNAIAPGFPNCTHAAAFGGPENG